MHYFVSNAWLFLQKVETTVWEVIYKKECTNVERHVCVNNDCNDYGCAGEPGRNDVR